MKNVVIDCGKLNQRRQAHTYLAKELDFPDYYGKNLDALFDCLTDIGECTVILKGAETLRLSDGYGVRILKVMEEAVRVNPGFKLEFEDDEIPESDEEDK